MMDRLNFDSEIPAGLICSPVVFLMSELMADGGWQVQIWQDWYFKWPDSSLAGEQRCAVMEMFDPYAWGIATG